MIEGTNVWLAFALMFLGIAVHFLTKLHELENTGRIVTPWTYWKFHPYASLMVIVGAVMLVVLQYLMGELSHTSALLTGMASNSMGDKLRAMAVKKQTDSLNRMERGSE